MKLERYSQVVTAIVGTVVLLALVAMMAVPTVLFVTMGGMAFGTLWAGALYDHFGYYAPAFASGVAFNLVNLSLLGFLVLRRNWGGGLRPALA